MSNSLIIQTAFLGDLLLGIPLFKAIKALQPGGKLTVLCRRGLGSFLLNTGLVDEVIEVDKKSRSEWSDAKRILREKHFDFIFCPHESPRSALFVMGLRAKKKIGFKAWFNGFIFDERVERPLMDPEAVRQLSLLKPLGSVYSSEVSNFERLQELPGGRFANGALVRVPAKIDMTLPSLMKLRSDFANTNDDWKRHLNANLVELDQVVRFKEKPIAVLAPGSVWATKMWTRDGFIAVGKTLSQRGFKVIISGSKEESDLCTSVASQIEGAVSLAGRTALFESAQVLAMSQLLVCNDSGAMHLGACSGVPTVSVFGPTVLDFGYRPWNDRAEVVDLNLGCRPCGTHGAKKCPIGTHACMQGIGAATVMAAVDRVL